MGKRRGRTTADDSRGLVNQLIIFESLNHEQGKIYTASDITLENGVAYVPTPDGQTLALALLQAASAYDSPPSITCKNPPACFHLVVDVHKAKKPGDLAAHIQEPRECWRIHILAVACNMPPA